MQSKQFEALAERLHDCHPNVYLKSEVNKIASNAMMNQWLHMVNEIADFCEEQNERFNRSRFLEACGVEE